MPSKELIIPLTERCRGCKKKKVFNHHYFCDKCYSEREKAKVKTKKTGRKKILEKGLSALKPGQISKENYFKH